MKFVFVLLIVAGIQLSQASWDSHIDHLIIQSRDSRGHASVDQAVIIGLFRGAKWTTDSHPDSLKISASEAENIARIFRSKDFSMFKAGEIRIDGVNYQYLRAVDNDGVIYAKKKGEGAIVMQASRNAIVIAHSPEGSRVEDAKKAVGFIVGYLESVGL